MRTPVHPAGNNAQVACSPPCLPSTGQQEKQGHTRKQSAPAPPTTSTSLFRGLAPPAGKRKESNDQTNKADKYTACSLHPHKAHTHAHPSGTRKPTAGQRGSKTGNKTDGQGAPITKPGSHQQAPLRGPLRPKLEQRKGTEGACFPNSGRDSVTRMGPACFVNNPCQQCHLLAEALPQQALPDFSKCSQGIRHSGYLFGTDAMLA